MHTNGESCGQVELQGVGIIRHMILFKSRMHSIFKMLVGGGFIMFLYFMRVEVYDHLFHERKLEGKNDDWKDNLNMREDRRKPSLFSVFSIKIYRIVWVVSNFTSLIKELNIFW